MRKRTLFLILSLAPFLSQVHASETRVDSIGGLTLVVTDESQDIRPFTLGNPAGLALLPPQSRFDLAGQWFEQSVAIADRTTHLYGTLGKLGSDPVKFHGLILFPNPRWAVQLDGDILRNDDDYRLVLVSDGIDQSRQLIRTAYNFGPLVLGAELRPYQLGLKFEQQNSPFNPSDSVTGDGSIVQWDTTVGLLAQFPGDPGPKQPRFSIGGIYSTQPIASEAKLQLNVISSGGPTTLDGTFFLKGLSYEVFGPEIYFESPGSFQGALVGRVINSSSSMEINSTSSTIALPAFKLYDQSETTGCALFKTEGAFAKGISLKSGVFLSFDSKRSTTFKTDSTVSSINTTDNWGVQGGLGLEKKDDYIVGIQGELNIAGGDLDDTVVVTTGATNFMGYKLSLGGEKWLSKEWAFRTGFQFENDLNQGTQDYQTKFFLISDGQRIITTTINLGVGYQDASFHGDFVLSYGQPLLYDSPDPQAFASQIIVQLAAGFFFK